MKFVAIKPGVFLMGSNETAEEIAKHYGNKMKPQQKEYPQHRVKITRGFLMAITPVTQGQYKALMGNNPSEFSKTGTDLELRPVEKISYNAAVAFCMKLGEKEAKNYRLPSEAEWKYACRAGAATAYYFGNDPTNLGDYAWFDGNSGGGTHPVGQKKPNAWGLYDMHGNVWQWCSDWSGPYPAGEVTDPVGGTEGPDHWRVLRGGSWWDVPFRCRAAIRHGHPPFKINSTWGIRVCLDDATLK